MDKQDFLDLALTLVEKNNTGLLSLNPLTN